MQNVFKIMATIAVWILYLLALMGIIWTFVASNEPWEETVAFFALWVVTLALSVVVMRLRKDL